MTSYASRGLRVLALAAARCLPGPPSPANARKQSRTCA